MQSGRLGLQIPSTHLTLRGLNLGSAPQNEISLKSTLRIFSEFNFRVTSLIASNYSPLTVRQILKKSIRRNTLFGGTKIWGCSQFSTSTPSCTPGPKFLWEFLGHPKRCRTPLELCRNLFPVSSYGCLNIAKIATLGAIILTTPDYNFKIISAIDRDSTA